MSDRPDLNLAEVPPSGQEAVVRAARVARAASESFDLATVLRVALHELDRLLPRHVGAVWLVEEKRGDSNFNNGNDRGAAVFPPLASMPGEPAEASLVLAQVSAACPRGPVEPGWRVAARDTPFVACLREGAAYHADLSPADPDPLQLSWLARGLGAADAASCFVVPLRAGDQTVGLLQSVCPQSLGFTDEQVQLLYLVADLLGPAVSHCRLFERLHTAYEALRLTQAHLIQAEKMRALGELASGMAHEFNNSLCGALGFLELALLNDQIPAEVLPHLRSARTCALDAAQTVSRVQDFARWQHRDPCDAVVDLNELVRQNVELIRHKADSLPHARARPVVIELRLHDGPACVAGNATELREVLTNLAFNAVDAMTLDHDRRAVKRPSSHGLPPAPPRPTDGPRGGTLTLCTRVEAGHACLCVSDTGVGIPEAVRQRLFEPFFTTKGEKGNGLGLPVVFAIVQRHGGEIRVESEVGRGATFTVRLPACPPAPQSPGAAREANAPPAAASGLRVLVVEDEENVGAFLGTALKSLGHRPHVTNHGRDALAALAAERFDVVLTDLGLPEISGEEVAKRAARLAPGTPVVLLTGWAEQLEAQNDALENVTRILSKPVTLATLAATLAEVSAR